MTTDRPTIALCVFGKTPAAGQSKTRLSPPLTRHECSELSACFIRDLAATMLEVTSATGDVGYAVYTPAGSEAALKPLLPEDFRLLLQVEGDFGTRLLRATEALFKAGHRGVILINSDSPTLPRSILQDGVAALRAGAPVVLGPALDGGYTMIGLSGPYEQLFHDVPWSTSEVYRTTLARAATAGLPVMQLPCWYDIDDAASLELLVAEFAGVRPGFAAASVDGARAPVTRTFLERSGLAGRLKV